MRKLLLLSFIIAFISCNENAERADTPYSNNDSKINSLFGEVDTASPGTSTSKIIVEPTGLRIVKENKDTFVSVYSRVEKTFTYYESTLDTFTLKYNGGVKPPDPEPPAPEPTERTNIIYEDMFESSDPKAIYADQRQWCCNYSVTSSDKIVREGSRSVRMEHRGTESISGGYRVEFQSDKYFKPAADLWYGYSMYFENFKASGVNDHIPQWHPTISGGSASLGIYTGSNTFHVRLNPEGDESAFTLKNGKQIVNGKWYDFVWHVKWAANGGRVELWIDGEKYVDYTGATLTKGGTPYFKLGLNRFASSNTSKIFYVDAFRIGNASATYKDVAP